MFSRLVTDSRLVSQPNSCSLTAKSFFVHPPLPPDFSHLWAGDVQLCMLFIDAGTLETRHEQLWRL
jgi:hypothetical protein